MINARSVNHYICGPGVTFPDFAAAAREAGIEAVGVTRAAIDELGVSDLRRCLADHGLCVSSLNSAGYFTRPDAAKTRDESFAMVDAAAELRAEALCVIAGGAGEMPLAEARARAADGFAVLAERADAAGVLLGLEPIHPADILTKGVVNSCAQALDLIAPYRTAALIVDLYHSWWDADLLTTLRERADRVALLQICNLRLADGMSVGRDRLSEGPLDLRALLQEILASGYAGTLEFEIFDRDLRGRDALDLVRAYPAELDALVRRAALSVEESRAP